MRVAEYGDRVQIHYVKRFQDGGSFSSRERGPFEMTVGAKDARLPGLGNALVGLQPGATVCVVVPPGQAWEPASPTRILRWSRERFPKNQNLVAGRWVPFTTAKGRRRLVRIVEVKGRVVVVDTNHRRAGQGVEMEVELIRIEEAKGPSAWIGQNHLN